MNLNNILLVYNTGHIVPNAPIEDNLFGMKLGGRGIITIATGNPISIVTNKAQNAISTILSYSPKQSGSGDPSPSNVRPISGWTEANLGVNSETPTKTISLGGTYYGFIADLENGTATIDRMMVDLGDLTYTKYDTTQGTLFRSSTISNSNLTYNDVNFMCTSYKVVRSGSRTDLTISCARTNTVDIIDDRFAESSQNEFKTAVTGQKLVYELATPIELPLTPQTVALLAGNNTLWTDGDSVTITYRR